MRSSEQVLIRFLATHPTGKLYDGASLDGLCGFKAIQSALPFFAVELSWKTVKTYVARQKLNGLDLATGTTFADLRRFIVVSKLPVDIDVLKVNLYCGGPGGVDGITATIQEDGVYLVCGMIRGSPWGHVFVVWKAASYVFSVDEGEKARLVDIPWLGDIRYIRRICRQE